MKLIPVVAKKNGKRGKGKPDAFVIVDWAYVDDRFYGTLIKWRWHKNTGGYAARHELGQMISIHREVMRLAGRTDGIIPDHKDHNKMNNQLSNLRPGGWDGNAQNRILSSNNTSGFKGVHQDKRGKFIARIGARRHFLGSYGTAQEAAREYDQAAAKLYGEFACTNKMLGLI